MGVPRREHLNLSISVRVTRLLCYLLERVEIIVVRYFYCMLTQEVGSRYLNQAHPLESRSHSGSYSSFYVLVLRVCN